MVNCRFTEGISSDKSVPVQLPGLLDLFLKDLERVWNISSVLNWIITYQEARILKLRFAKAFILVVLSLSFICMCEISAAIAEELPTTFQNFVSDSRWSAGTTWGGSQRPKLSSYDGYGCCAYCADFTMYCFGNYNPRGGVAFYDTAEIRAGDVLTVGNQSDGTGHWFVCLKRSGNSLYVAEGNYGGKVRIGWNYSIKNTHYFNEDSRYFTAGYHFMDSNNDPYGYLDAASGGNGTISISGWAKDDDAPGTSLSIHVYVGGSAGSGASCYVITANSSRPDVGGNYGYSSTITVKERGSQSIYVYAINVPTGNNPCIGEATVTIQEPICTVTYNANGGSVTPASKTITYGDAYGELPTPTRSGYTFDGWYTAASGGTQVTGTSTVTGDITIYAHWTGISSTLTYDANGGTVSPASKTVTYGSAYGTLATPTRAGYSFSGWYTEAAGGTQVTNKTNVDVTSDHTVYAHWTANTYTITFNPSGGRVSTATKLVTYNSAYGTLPTPTKPGYNFDGWYTTAEGGSKITDSTVMTAITDQTVYAHWSQMGEQFFPGSIQTIDEESFIDNSHISHVEIPESCSSIESKAFANCENLVSVRILGKNTTFESDSFEGSPNVVIYCYSGSKAQRLASGDGIECHLIGVESDWVKTDDVPSGAEITDQKWTYTLREYTENASASYSGWTKYNSEITSWSDWSAWQNEEVTAANDREVQTQSIVTGYNMITYCVSGPNGRSYQPSPTYTLRLQHGPYWWSKAEFDSARVFAAGSYFDFASNVAGYVLDGTAYCKWDGSDTGGYVPMFVQDTTYGTQWKYRDAVYTYYYYRDVDSESTTDPTGQENVSNVQEWVKYIF